MVKPTRFSTRNPGFCTWTQEMADRVTLLIIWALLCGGATGRPDRCSFSWMLISRLHSLAAIFCYDRSIFADGGTMEAELASPGMSGLRYLYTAPKLARCVSRADGVTNECAQTKSRAAREDHIVEAIRVPCSSSTNNTEVSMFRESSVSIHFPFCIS